MFNNDPAISKTYTGESWTEEFMEYGCYCNKAMRGGGKPDPTIPDSHESLCLGLINIIGFLFTTVSFSRKVASPNRSHRYIYTSKNDFLKVVTKNGQIRETGFFKETQFSWIRLRRFGPKKY